MFETPSVFVGHSQYPNVSVGLLSTPQDRRHDAPQFWSQHNYSIPSVTHLRKELLNLRQQTHVKQKSVFSDLALTVTPPTVEVTYTQKSNNSLSPQQEAIPFGPSAQLGQFQIIDNLKTNPLLEKYADDIDVSATTALHELFIRGVDEHSLSKMLSVGNLGRGTLRKLVPTRWSITAVDDTLSGELKSQIVLYDTLHPSVYVGGYMGNYFIILFFEGPYSFEFIEVVTESKQQFTDWESPLGRKEYAKNTAGGYYATRLAINEFLSQSKKQASVIAIRFITEAYYQSLGVWVVREACRKALSQTAVEFEDRKMQCLFAEKLALKKFGIPIDLSKSPILTQVLKQSTLSSFF